MDERSSLLPQARRILELAAKDKRAAERALGQLSLDTQVAVVCEAPAASRMRILALTPKPEEVIPRLPEAEFCFTAKAAGADDTSWLLEYASTDQFLACLDLDAWSGLTPDRVSLDWWLTAFSEAGEEALLRAAQNLDAELLVLALCDRITAVLKPSKEDAEDWEPPEGSQTLDGSFYVFANREGDDIVPVLRTLDTLFRRDYWLYFRLLQGTIWELESDLEEWALRWRTGRLEDLGFPSWDESMRIYGFVRPEQRADLPEGARPLDVEEWPLPVWLPDLPTSADARHSLFRCAAELDPVERSAFFYAFVSLANKVAVADRMSLGDTETLPAAIEKAATVISRGLEHIASENRMELVDVLRQVTLERLFRVGASLAGAKPS